AICWAGSPFFGRSICGGPCAGASRAVRTASVVAFPAVGGAGQWLDLGREFVGFVRAGLKIPGQQAEAVRDGRVPGDTDHLAERRCLPLEIVFGDHALPTLLFTPHTGND